METKHNKKTNTATRIEVQGHCGWSEMGEDCTITYVFIERPISASRAEVVYYPDLQARKDDSVSCTSTNVPRICWC